MAVYFNIFSFFFIRILLLTPHNNRTNQTTLTLLAAGLITLRCIFSLNKLSVNVFCRQHACVRDCCFMTTKLKRQSQRVEKPLELLALLTFHDSSACSPLNRSDAYNWARLSEIPEISSIAHPRHGCSKSLHFLQKKYQ